MDKQPLALSSESIEDRLCWHKREKPQQLAQSISEADLVAEAGPVSRSGRKRTTDPLRGTLPTRGRPRHRCRVWV